MADANNKETQSKSKNPLEPRDFFSMLPKVEFKFPSFDQQSEKPDASVEKAEQIEIAKPPTVFMGNRQKNPPPLEIEAEEYLGRTSNPIVLWQVYAIGGFFLLKWVWARWKERKEMGSKKGGSDDDEQPPAVDDSQYV